MRVSSKAIFAAILGINAGFFMPGDGKAAVLAGFANAFLHQRRRAGKSACGAGLAWRFHIQALLYARRIVKSADANDKVINIA